jgi:hypothetical protein
VPARTVRETNGAVWWRVPSDRGGFVKKSATQPAKTLRSFPEISVQSSVAGRGDVLFVDQDGDRIELSLGQAIDLIDALACAVGKPVKYPKGFETT